MQIREVRDAQSVELGRHARELDLDHAPPEPARLEPPPRDERKADQDKCKDDPGHGEVFSRIDACVDPRGDQTDSFSVTGATETT